MQKRSNHFNFIIQILLITGFSSCNVQEIDQDLTKKSLNETKTLEYIKSLGFPDSVIEEFDDRYVVEGDISFPKENDYGVKDVSVGRVEQKTSSVTGVVSYQNVANMTVSVTDQMPLSGDDNWRVEIQQAISEWNNTSDNRINFVYVGSGSADINIQVFRSTTSYYVEAVFPSNGKPGDHILLNLDFGGDEIISSARKKTTFLHAFSHSLGFLHTDSNYSDGNKIPGTPCYDANSLMNGTGEYTRTSFSQYDIIAFQMVYPTDRPANTAPFLRYVNSGTGDHFYTWNFNEVYCGINGYVAEGFEGFVYTVSTAGTVPLYRYYNGTDHFYTRIGNNYAGYVEESLAGYVYDSQVAGSIPIYRYRNGNNGDHFYTKFNAQFQDYVYEGVGWYAIP